MNDNRLYAIPGATDETGHYSHFQHAMCHDEMKAYSFE
jgi:hypothetical protein